MLEESGRGFRATIKDDGGTVKEVKKGNGLDSDRTWAGWGDVFGVCVKLPWYLLSRQENRRHQCPWTWSQWEVSSSLLRLWEFTALGWHNLDRTAQDSAHWRIWTHSSPLHRLQLGGLTQSVHGGDFPLNLVLSRPVCHRDTLPLSRSSPGTAPLALTSVLFLSLVSDPFLQLFMWHT